MERLAIAIVIELIVAAKKKKKAEEATSRQQQWGTNKQTNPRIHSFIHSLAQTNILQKPAS